MDTAYFAILRRKQMTAMNNIPEDEWPDPSILADYQPRFDADVNYYYPEDLFIPLGSWIRDHTIEKRKESVANRNRDKGRAIQESLLG